MKRIIASQFKRPNGILGKLVGRIMQNSNSFAYIIIIDGLKINNNDRILEIGYGTGHAINLVSQKYIDTKITGVDFSQLMHKKASKLNWKLIEEERVTLIQDDFILHNFQELQFDKIYCINVIYFWNDLEQGIRKVFELLPQSGVFGIFMVTPEDLVKLKFTKLDVFNKYSFEDVKETLINVGFSNVKKDSITHKDLKAYCIYATK
jgi:cyclopropane fatty-acyl-phospholipid synthase-like methyltransferase